MLLTQPKPSFGANLDSRSFLPIAANATAQTAATAVQGRRLRESCDFCTKRKRKCDGDGVNPCSFCIAKNQPECHYSVRRLTGPRSDSASRRAAKATGKAARAAAPSSESWGDNGGSGRTSGLVSVQRCSSKLPMKRARLSPSPATGLIGLRENVYVAEFFRTMGFLPFTNESFIRKAMVKTMFRAVQERDPGLHGASVGGDDIDEEEEEEEEGEWRDGAGTPRKGPGNAIESAAGACVLWSTVGVGCLIGGRPKSSVDGYARLAREALSGCFDDVSVQTARAFTAMALLQNFRGDEEKFNKYIDFARSTVRALPPEEIPTDLTDAHMFVKACDLFDGFYHQLDEEDLRDAMGASSGDAEAVNLAKQPRPIQQAELCRWLLKTDIRLSACFSMDMQNSGFFGNPGKAGTQTPCSRPRSESGPGSPSASDGNGSGGALSNSRPHVAYDQVPGTGAGLDTPAPRMCWLRQLSGTSAEPPPPGPITQKFAARVLPDVKLMMHVTRSPEVRGGVGELYLRMIMAYVCLLQGQPNNAVDGLLRCTDILAKKPGICRFTSWKHLAHCCLAGMAASNLPEKYEELRTAYNSVVDNHLEAPPFEEFRGMRSFCENILCKSVYSFFIAVTSLEREPSHLCDDAPATSKDEAKLCPTVTKSQDVDMPPYSSAASDESWAKGVFDKDRQTTDMEESGNGGKASPPAGATAAAGITAAPAAAPAELGAAFGFVGAFGVSVEKERHPTGVRFGLGAGAGSARSTTGSSFSSSISSFSSSSFGPVTTGDISAVTAGQDGNRSQDQQDQLAADGMAPLPMLPSVLSAQTTGAAPGPAELGGLGLLHASELEGAEVAGVLDAVDELLGEGDLEGFGESGSEEDMLPFAETSA